jgi:tripartite-type tricarboxylate transporter receptor subunit TctC
MCYGFQQQETPGRMPHEAARFHHSGDRHNGGGVADFVTRGELSIAADHADRAVLSRRAHRRAGAHPRRADAKDAGADRGDRNVTGASGSVAGIRAARATPDGYTIIIGHWGTHVLNGAVYSLQYDVLNDFDPVGLIGNGPQLIIGRPTLPALNLNELIGWLKDNPNKATAGTAGPGSGSHVAGVFFQNQTGTGFSFVPYRGAGPALNDLMAGHIDLMFDQATNSLPQVRGGNVRAYAVTSRTRLASAPDIPTVDEAGLPGLYIAYWHGIWAPKNTPADAIARLNAAVVAALADPAVQQRFLELGQETPPPERQTPAALKSHQTAEIEKWWPIVKAANIKAE